MNKRILFAAAIAILAVAPSLRAEGQPLRLVKGQLYNIREDLSEKTDLSNSQPQIAKALLAELKGWVNKTRAPIPKTLNRSFTADGEIMNKGDKRSLKKK